MVYTLKELVNIKYGKNQKNVENSNGKYPIYGTGGLMSYADKYLYDKPSVLIGRKGSIGKVRFSDKPFWTVDTLFYTEVNEDIVIPKYLYYKMLTIDMSEYNEGTTIPSLRTDTLYRIELDIPNKEIQKRVIKVLDYLEKKMKTNNEINNNLYEEAIALYKNKFKGIDQDKKIIGDYIVPKRGKNLLTRDAIDGDTPVVAGGIEPSAYHNQFNTKSPVITISASGANAGYINLWNIPVWASDCSYIDDSITKNVYFWYIVLKTRQNEIFDAQRNPTAVLGDTGYPYYIAQFGVVGIILLTISIKNLLKMVRPQKQINWSAILLLIYLCIALTGESTLLNAGVEFAVTLAVILAKNEKKILGERINKI